MSNLIKKFNVTINGDSATYEVGADAKNVQFSDEATSPFTNETVEDNIPVGIVEKAENRIYGNAYIKNNDWDDIEGTPEDFGPIDDVNPDRRIEGAGALTITYGFNSLAKGHHSTAIGFGCEANGWASHAEGWHTTTGVSSNYAHAEGGATNAVHNMAHAEGDGTEAAGYSSHAEGSGTHAYGISSHTEGASSIIGSKDTIAWQNSNQLHQGDITNDMSNNNDVSLELAQPKQYINGQLSHAEGMGHIIFGSCCHAEGISNMISNVYASTVMGEENKIYSNSSVAMGSKNTLNAGSNNSLILGNNNINPGYPNSLFLGQYCGIGTGEGQAPALVIGSGDANTLSNLMTIRHPQTGVASPTNRGDLWGDHLNAHFASITTTNKNNWTIAKIEQQGTKVQEVNYGFHFNGWKNATTSMTSRCFTMYFFLNTMLNILIVELVPFDTLAPIGIDEPYEYYTAAGLNYSGFTSPDYYPRNPTDLLLNDPNGGEIYNWIINNFSSYNKYTERQAHATYVHDNTAEFTISHCYLNIYEFFEGEVSENNTPLRITANHRIGRSYGPNFRFVYYGKK